MADSRAGLLVLILALAAAPSLEAQGVIKKMKDRARQQAQGRADRAADEAVDSAASVIEKAARCLISDAQCIKAAQEAGQPILVTGPDGQPVSSTDSAAAVGAVDMATDTLSSGVVSAGEVPTAEVPTEGVPLDAAPPNVLASASFSEDELGLPPQGVEVHQGAFTVQEHEVEEGLWLTGEERGGGSFFLALPQKLPPVFTLTFDVLGRGGFIGVHPSGVPTGAHALVETTGIGFINDGKKMTQSGSIPEREGGMVHHVRIVGRDSTLTLYIDGNLIAEATSAALARRGKRIAFGMAVYGSPERIGAIQVVEGAD